ncbi:MAG TPA: hypothetical protein VMW25_01965 [Clostridia bacterium]|nr:hypothetical protein [Clostridia bacterium]
MSKLLAKVNIGKEWFLKPEPGQSIKDVPQFQTIGALVSIILKNVYTAAGVLLLVLLLFGGISIILGAGGGDPKKTGQGQKAVVAALTGFLIIFASYWIIQIIAFITGIDELKKIFNLGS